VITPDGSIGIYFVNRSGLNVTVRVWELGPTHAQQVRILLVVANPPGDETAGERVVIRNDRPTRVPMGGWRLQDERSHPSSPPWTFVFPNVWLEPGADLTVWTHSGTHDSTNLYWGLNHPIWNNDGDAALLFDPQGTQIARLAW
jgi:hypothetical protein